MELNERQQRVLRGEICPYCGRETELVNADKIYSRKGLGDGYDVQTMQRLCRCS